MTSERVRGNPDDDRLLREIMERYRKLSPVAQEDLQQGICWAEHHLWWLVLLAIGAGLLAGWGLT